jgi:hypothetical protein
MTSEALITAQASSPALRPRSSTASLVIDDVTDDHPAADIDPHMGGRLALGEGHHFALS